MLLKRFYDTKLAQASYLVGCQRTGESLVMDANRDSAQYLEAARAEGLRVTHVTETHIHADYLSGSRELAQRAGAKLLLSGEGGPDWQYAFAKEANAVILKDGDAFKVGNVVVKALHTPGHTPEHLSFTITDGASTDRPMGVFTGDFIFVGDVGRPDLLERAAKIAGTMEAGARQLYASLQRFKQLPDYLQLWPAHGAGSACGKALGAVPQTTLGYERFANWGLASEREDDFVRDVLEGQPEPPAYFAQMKRLNRDGPNLLGGFKRPERLPGAALAELLAKGAVVVDVRGTAAFAKGFVPGTINIPLSSSFPTYAGSLLSYEKPVYLLSDEELVHRIEEPVRDLALIGLDDVKGFLGGDAFDAWRAAGRELGSVPQTTAEALAPRLAKGEVLVVDVRGRSEWDAGHIAGASHLPLGSVPDRLAEIPRDRTVVMQCETGSRSAIAASVLRLHGFRQVENLTGGFVAWKAAGLPVASA